MVTTDEEFIARVRLVFDPQSARDSARQAQTAIKQEVEKIGSNVASEDAKISPNISRVVEQRRSANKETIAMTEERRMAIERAAASEISAYTRVSEIKQILSDKGIVADKQAIAVAREKAMQMKQDVSLNQMAVNQGIIPYADGSKNLTKILEGQTGVLDKANLQKQLAAKNMKKLGEETGKTSSFLGNFTKDIGHAITKMAFWAISGTVLYGTLRAFQQTLTAGYEYIEMIDTIQDVSGASAESVNTMTAAMIQQGIPFKDAGRALGEFVEIYQMAARQGDLQSYTLFRQWGIDLADAEGKILSVGNVIDQIKAKAKSDPSQTGAMATQFFGTMRGWKLTDWLTQSEEDTKKADAALKKYGLSLTNLDIEKFRDLQKELELVKMAQVGIGLQLQEELLPLITRLKKEFSEFAITVGQGLRFLLGDTPTIDLDLSGFGEEGLKEAATQISQLNLAVVDLWRSGQKIPEGYEIAVALMQPYKREIIDANRLYEIQLELLAKISQTRQTRKKGDETFVPPIRVQSGALFTPNYFSEYDKITDSLTKLDISLKSTGSSFLFLRDSIGLLDEKYSKLSEIQKTVIADLGKTDVNIRKQLGLEEGVLITPDMISQTINELQQQLDATILDNERKLIQSRMNVMRGLEQSRNQMVESLKKVDKELVDTLAKDIRFKTADAINQGIVDGISAAIMSGNISDLGAQIGKSVMKGISDQLAVNITEGLGLNKIGDMFKPEGMLGGLASASGLGGFALGGLGMLASGLISSWQAADDYAGQTGERFAAESKFDSKYLDSGIKSIAEDVMEKLNTAFDESLNKFWSVDFGWFGRGGYTEQDTFASNAIRDFRDNMIEVLEELDDNFKTFTQSSERLNHEIGMNSVAYDTNIEQLSAWTDILGKVSPELEAAKVANEEQLALLDSQIGTLEGTIAGLESSGGEGIVFNAILENYRKQLEQLKTTQTELQAVGEDLNYSLEQATWATEERIAAIEREIKAERESMATRFLERDLKYGDISETNYADTLLKNLIQSYGLDLKPEDITPDKLASLYESGDLSGSMVESLLDAADALILAPYTEWQAEFNRKVQMRDASLDTPEEQLAEIERVAALFSELPKSVRESLETDLFKLREQINMSFISGLEDSYDLELSMRTKMYDETHEKIDFYTKLIAEAIERNLDSETIRKFQNELAVLTSSYQQYSDALQSLDWKLDFMPSLDEAQKKMREVFELGELKKLLSEYGGVLSQEDLHALKKRIFNIEINQDITIKTGDINQAADWETIMKRISELIKVKGTAWSNIILTRAS